MLVWGEYWYYLQNFQSHYYAVEGWLHLWGLCVRYYVHQPAMGIYSTREYASIKPSQLTIIGEVQHRAWRSACWVYGIIKFSPLAKHLVWNAVSTNRSQIHDSVYDQLSRLSTQSGRCNYDALVMCDTFFTCLADIFIPEGERKYEVSRQWN
jgi:hypothetical protein